MPRIAGLGFAVILAGLGADAGAADKASGQLIVDGEPIALEHAYVQAELDSEGNDMLTVLLTEKPLPATALDGENFLAGLLHPTTGNGVYFSLRKGDEPWWWNFVHPSFPDGAHQVGFMSSLRVEVRARSKDRLTATAFTAEPQSFEDHRYELRVDLDAAVRVPAALSLPPDTAADLVEARKRLRQKGRRFKPEDFTQSYVFPETVRLYLDAGMDPDVLHPQAKITSLQIAMAWNCRTAGQETIRTLIEAGADVNRPNPDGNVPLFEAYRCPEILEALLDAGARLDAPSTYEGLNVGRSLMSRALSFNEPEVVRVLIRRGYDLQADGAKLLEWAGPRPELVKILTEAGVTPPAPKAKPKSKAARSKPKSAPATKSVPASRTPRDAEQAKAELSAMELVFDEEGLFLRIMELDVHGVLLFMEAGMTPNIQDKWASKHTPLRHVTSTCNYQEDKAAILQIVEALLAHGADVEEASQYGETPLMIAANYCPPEIVQTLVKAGANVAVVDQSQDTAMSKAIKALREDRGDIVQVLIDAGFDVAGDSERLLKDAEGKPEIEAMLRKALER